MPTAATLSFQSLSVTSSAVNSWQHCNPGNYCGRRDRRSACSVAARRFIGVYQLTVT
jgi:hypothetical protein